MKPLKGVVVVSCEHAVAAPLATRHLADLGARVIKIERPGAGDFARNYDETVNGMSSHFVWLNRSKESVALDLKRPDAQETMQRLLSRADVFVQNLAPGAAERLGLGAAQLRRNYPRLVTCSVSGYGPSGPSAGKKSYDLLVQAEVGLLSITGTPEHPAKAGIPVADISAGMYAYSSILAALYAREQTGEGAQIEISLFDSLIEWMSYPIYYTRYGKTAPPRTGTDHAAIAPYGLLQCGDNSEFVVAVQNDREWTLFCEHVLARPELLNDPRFASVSARSANRDALNEELEKVLRHLSGPRFEELLEQAGIAYARKRDMTEVFDHPQFAMADRWMQVDTPAGSLAVMRPTGLANDWDRAAAPIPAVGEHTDAVLAWLEDPDDGRHAPRASADVHRPGPAGDQARAAASGETEPVAQPVVPCRTAPRYPVNVDEINTGGIS